MTGDSEDMLRLDENVRRSERKLKEGLAVAEVEDERSIEVVKNLLLLWLLESRIRCSDKEVVTTGCCNNKDDRKSGMVMRLQESLDLMLM
jgi:hypothetical protein